MSINLDEFIQGYIECALWSSLDNADDFGGEPLDANYDESDLAPSARVAAEADCRDFVESNADELDDSGLSSGRAGHDFWLTRNGHGAGFWDEGIGATGVALSEAARVYGGVDLYIGDDGQIHGG